MLHCLPLSQLFTPKLLQNQHGLKVKDRVVELLNFITCPRTSKWSESTCSAKIYLPENLYFFLFPEENICCGYSLEAPHRGASNEYPQHVFFEKKKIFLATAMKSLSQYK